MKALLQALKNLWGSGRQSRFLADLAPKFLAAAFTTTKNPIFLESLRVQNGSVQTPILEDIERLDHSDGGENLSMIFKILKRGEKLDLLKPNLTENDVVDSGLRYDLTMPLSRYFAANRANLRVPFKVIQIDQVFRAERPQKGRYRELFQCGGYRHHRRRFLPRGSGTDCHDDQSAQGPWIR